MITNDDLKSSPDSETFGGVFFSSAGQINDCDRFCFDQVRTFARVDPSINPNWRRELLDAIEVVRQDHQWQGYLRNLYDAHGKVCQITLDKAEELRRAANPRNVTQQEIVIDEKAG